MALSTLRKEPALEVTHMLVGVVHSSRNLKPTLDLLALHTFGRIGLELPENYSEQIARHEYSPFFGVLADAALERGVKVIYLDDDRLQQMSRQLSIELDILAHEQHAFTGRGSGNQQDNTEDRIEAVKAELTSLARNRSEIMLEVARREDAQVVVVGADHALDIADRMPRHRLIVIE